MSVAAIRITNESEVRVVRVPLGPRGAPGPPGSALAPIAFAFGDASPSTVHTLSAAALIISATLSITQGFNGTDARVKVGTDADDELLLAETDSDVSQAIDYQNDCYEQLAAGTPIVLSITPGAGASQGTGFLILELLYL